MAINQNEARNKEAKLHYIRASYLFSKIFSQEDSTLGLNLTHLSISTDTSKKSWFFSNQIAHNFHFLRGGYETICFNHACMLPSKQKIITHTANSRWLIHESLK